MAEITGIVASLIGPAIEVGKWIAGPIKRGFYYLWSFEDNIESLRGEAHKLKVASDVLHMKVDVAKRNDEVEKLLENARKQEDITKEIENKIPKVQKGCLNLTSRCSLSKKAKKTAESLMKLHDSIEQSISAVDATPAGVMDSLPYGQDEKFESRKQIEESIMEALRDRNVNTIGICGMGGIGKTTMAERIMERVKEENLFDEVVMLLVSQQGDISKIQRVIAKKLGLAIEVDEHLSKSKLREGLRNNSKRILIVLDDIWKSLDLLEDFHSIPCANTTYGRCTILLTSRDRQILKIMNAQDFEIKVLDESEAWFLFKEKIGRCADIEDLHSVAKDVARECKGLPLALVTVSGALKNKTDRGLWDDALARLRSPDLICIPQVLKDVYEALRLSYDYLEIDNYQHAQKLFLLCSIFKEDSDIPLEILTWYGMGLCMFEGINNLNKARDRIHTLVEILKDRFLLLDGVDKDNIKMHDVIRDMASYIASKEQIGFVMNLDGTLMDWSSWENSCKKCSWISMILSNKAEFPIEFEFHEELQISSLRLLVMQGREKQTYNQIRRVEPYDELRLPDNFFDGMKEIIVLSLEYIMIKSLPAKTTEFFRNVKTLRLFNCGILETVSVVGELLKLEILSCIDCEKIEALPVEIGRLSHLRLLEIIRCRSLKTIVRGVVSSLVRLEELKLRDTFDGWETKDRSNNNNAALVELESLTNLTCLEIKIRNPNLVAEEVRLSPNIVKYDIQFVDYYPKEGNVTKSMGLDISEEINVGNWIQKLTRNIEYLELNGDGANKVNLVELENIKYLNLECCSTVKKLMNTATLIPRKSNNSFKNLVEIYIWKCHSLCFLFPMSMVRNILLQLKRLEIEKCREMEALFCDDDDDNDDKMEKDGENHHLIPDMVFPKLKRLDLRYLPRLATLCRGVQSIEFPQLTDIWIVQLPKLTSLIGSSESHDDKSLMHQFFNQKVVAPCIKRLGLHWLDQNNYITSVWCYQIPTNFFCKLRSLDIYGLNGIINLMSSSIAGNLVHLRILDIRNCREMLQVIIGDEEEEKQLLMGSQVQLSLFPCLVELTLFCLPKLRSFCLWKYHHLKLPSLTFVNIHDCPQMETFTQGSLNTPNLGSINDVSVTTKDLNEAIQRHFNPKGSTSAGPTKGEGEMEEIEEEEIGKNL